MNKHIPGPLDEVLRDVVLTDVERRLIAAAPDMLTALKLTSDLFTTTDNIVDPDARIAMSIARAAIAKAEGRT